MKTNTFLIFFLLLLITAACSRAETPAIDIAKDTTSAKDAATLEKKPTDSVEDNRAVDTPPITEAETLITQSAEPADAIPTIDSAINPVSECTIVSTLPDKGEKASGAFSVKEDDWVIGAADAAVEIIEYGDFQ